MLLRTISLRMQTVGNKDVWNKGWTNRDVNSKFLHVHLKKSTISLLVFNCLWY